MQVLLMQIMCRQLYGGEGSPKLIQEAKGDVQTAASDESMLRFWQTARWVPVSFVFTYCFQAI
jgi:hypothetical protein